MQVFTAILISLCVAVPLPQSLRWSRKFDPERAAHLLRRAGFGGTPREIAAIAKLDRQRAVDSILQFGSGEQVIPFQLNDEPFLSRRQMAAADPKELQKRRDDRLKNEHFQARRISQWWIQTMVASPDPLQEKLVLFWHGHFTSGFKEVKSSRALYEQNQLFRRYAAGNYRDFLKAVTLDPAMILYLNSAQNRKGNPNENYARELMELFTLGTGHYTEQDVKEAARALTGVSIERDTGRSVFRGRLHDEGVKVFLGHRGTLGPEDIIDIILQQPAAAEFIARKMWTFFAYENPSDAVVKGLARVLRDNNYELKPMMRAMFLCDTFYSERARFTHVKSPVELLVGTLRMLEISPRDTVFVEQSLRAMGQQLLQPPNVKGWDGGLAWISTSTLYSRYNSIGRWIDGTDDEQERRRRAIGREMVRASFGKEGEMMRDGQSEALQPAYDPMPTMESENLTTIERAVDYYIARLLQREIEPSHRVELIEAVSEEWNRNRRGAIRLLLRLIVAMPEYQLS